jgi:hypothetical protein
MRGPAGHRECRGERGTRSTPRASPCAGGSTAPRGRVVPVQQIIDNDYNLDLRNPHGSDDLTHRQPQELVNELIDTEHEILAVLQELQQSLESTS